MKQVYSGINEHFKCDHVLCLLQTPQQVIVRFDYSTFSVRCFSCSNSMWLPTFEPCDYMFSTCLGGRRCQEKNIVYRVQRVKPNHGLAIARAGQLVKDKRS